MMFLGMNSSKLHTNFCWNVHRSDLGGVHKSDLGTLLDSNIFCRLTPYVSVQGNLILDHNDSLAKQFNRWMNHPPSEKQHHSYDETTPKNNA